MLLTNIVSTKTWESIIYPEPVRVWHSIVNDKFELLKQTCVKICIYYGGIYNVVVRNKGNGALYSLDIFRILEPNCCLGFQRGKLEISLILFTVFACSNPSMSSRYSSLSFSTSIQHYTSSFFSYVLWLLVLSELELE